MRFFQMVITASHCFCVGVHLITVTLVTNLNSVFPIIKLFVVI